MSEKNFAVQKYFAAQNSAEGFISYFGENLRGDRAERCYIIKGGPGVGKARLMSELAAEAEKKGATVEYYYCSSDPASLDGLFIALADGRTLSVLDGTLPHDEDAGVPGARDELIDLGAFWDAARLRLHRGEIEVLMRQKQTAFSRAYKCLAAAGELSGAARELRFSCADKEGIAALAASVAAELTPSRRMRTPLSAIGMRGSFYHDSFRAAAAHRIGVKDNGGCRVRELFFGGVRDALGGNCRWSPDLLLPRLCEGIIADDTAVIIGTGDEERTVDISHLVDEGAYERVWREESALEAAREMAFSSAKAAFAEASAAHFALEEIYAAAMDFSKKEEYSRHLCKHILA